MTRAEAREILDRWLWKFSQEHPIGIWALAAVAGFILGVPLCLFVNWLSGRP